MLIKNITDKGSPKPIGIGDYIIMPGESVEIPDEIIYVNEFDRARRKTGKKIILPSVILMAGLNQISYEETKVRKAPKAVEQTAAEESVVEEVVEKPKRTRKKAAE